MEHYALGQQPIAGYKFSSGIGYIALPTDITREKFISMCFQNLKVSIWTEDGGFTNQCPISYSDLNEVTFPDDPKQLGSIVVWVLESIHNQPIIVKVLDAPAMLGDNSEGQMRFKKVYKSAFAELTGSAKKGFLGLNLTTDKDAQFFINVRSRNHNASYNTEVDGNTNWFTTGNTNIQQNTGFLVKTLKSDDESTFASMQQDTTQHTFTNKKFIVNKDTEPFVLGKTFKKIFDNFIDTVAQSTVTTALGQMPLLNATQIAAFKQQTEQILSQVGFIDK